MNKLAVKQTGLVWRVTYDGRILGDDRGYATEAQALAEARKRVEQDKRDAIKYGRPQLLELAH